MKKIHEMTYPEYVKLRDSGMFYEFYPEATGNFKVDVKLSLSGKFKIESNEISL